MINEQCSKKSYPYGRPILHLHVEGLRGRESVVVEQVGELHERRLGARAIESRGGQRRLVVDRHRVARNRRCGRPTTQKVPILIMNFCSHQKCSQQKSYLWMGSDRLQYSL